MGEWVVVNRRTNERLGKSTFLSEKDARSHIDKMGAVFHDTYRPFYLTENQKASRMINEGLVKRDLEGILLPKISFDEYVPADPNTDNLVIAFFIKNVPEAVLPFKNFCEKCNGVLDVDYGDSDTIPNTSIIYIEMDRDKVKLSYVRDIVAQVSMLAGIEPDDFTMTFPHTNKKFPYDLKFLKKYLESRTRRDNEIAQRKAEKEARREMEDELAKVQKSNEKAQPNEKNGQPTTESVIETLVNAFVV